MSRTLGATNPSADERFHWQVLAREIWDQLGPKATDWEIGNAVEQKARRRYGRRDVRPIVRVVKPMLDRLRRSEDELIPSQDILPAASYVVPTPLVGPAGTWVPYERPSRGAIIGALTLRGSVQVLDWRENRVKIASTHPGSCDGSLLLLGGIE